MAVTTNPLVWNHHREVVDTGGIVGVAHYYDEEGQSLYLHSGDITTRTYEVIQGHWRLSEPGDPITIHDDSFNRMRIDHPSNGNIYGVATDGDTLTFLRYAYAMDISPLMESWSQMNQNDNAIAQWSGSVQNLGPDIFGTDLTLFQPGARITTTFSLGDSQAYAISVNWLDECGYDMTEGLVDISGRNTVGYFLNDQTFDDNVIFSGAPSDILTDILNYADVRRFLVQPIAGSIPFEFNPEDSLLDGITTILSAYTSMSNEMKIGELPDGTIVIGYQDWMANYLPNSYYTFNEGSDIFKRKTTKLSDSSYTHLRVTGKGPGKEDLTPVTVPVVNFKYWALGAHRTNHLTAPEGFTQAELQAWAEGQADKYQYIGIGEDFTAPFIPNLLVGDVAEVTDGVTGTALGVITEVTQKFSRSDGFKTEFSVDSGGVVTDGVNYTMYSRAAEVSGFNRRQRVVDLIRYIAKK